MVSLCLLRPHDPRVPRVTCWRDAAENAGCWTVKRNRREGHFSSATTPRPLGLRNLCLGPGVESQRGFEMYGPECTKVVGRVTFLSSLTSKAVCAGSSTGLPFLVIM